MPSFNYRQEMRIATIETTQFCTETDTREKADRIAVGITCYI